MPASSVQRNKKSRVCASVVGGGGFFVFVVRHGSARNKFSRKCVYTRTAAGCRQPQESELKYSHINCVRTNNNKNTHTLAEQHKNSITFYTRGVYYTLQ